jgi:hypothetical protein
MPNTLAEVARTLAGSTEPARVQVPGAPCLTGVRHGADPQGRILLFDRDSAPLTVALRTPGPVTVEIPDPPPLPFSPSWGRLRLHGHAEPLHGASARAAAAAIAETLADPDLLDVGDGTTVVAVTPERITLAGRERDLLVDLDEYRGATPDPLGRHERDLLVDLVDHHGPRLYPFLRHQLGAAGVTLGPESLPCPLRLDRHGLLVSVPDDDLAADRPAPCYRLRFVPALTGQEDLVQRLHTVLFHGERGH